MLLMGNEGGWLINADDAKLLTQLICGLVATWSVTAYIRESGREKSNS